MHLCQEVWIQAVNRLMVNTIQIRDDYRCVYCGKDCLGSIENGHECSVDHRKPLTKSGKDTDDNAAPSASLTGYTSTGHSGGCQQNSPYRTTRAVSR